ncbi:Oligosaccharyltransferase subunit Ribophorin II-domain-containing protein [Xylariaceae sp. FL0804]|nr:Oligosaccharyltransferase subunit Ribophorin II-domain-containing protein [Xylariaceae sp. FL0804]
MRFLQNVLPSLLLLAAGAAQAASSWGFDDATVSVISKKGAGAKEKFNAKAPLPQSLVLGTADSLKVILTATEGGKGARPHQAFVVLREPASGLEAPFPMTVKDSGKAVVEIKHADLPVQLAASAAPLRASVVLASFGAAAGVDRPVFDVDAAGTDASGAPVASAAEYEPPLRYGRRDEIHHVFRADAQSPPVVVSLVFALAVAAAVPALFVAWLALGGNVSHLSRALSDAPLAHGVFFGSILALEAVFGLYYASWTLFQMLPAVGLLGAATFLSGTKALGEVQSRRLTGDR